MKIYRNLLLMLLVLLSAACTEEGKQQAAHHDNAASHTTYTCPMHPQVVQNEPGTCPICNMDLVAVTASGQSKDALMLSESQLALGNIQVKRVKSDSLAPITLLTGKLVSDQSQVEVISSRAAGRIEQLYFQEPGQRVRQGQPLYQLYSEELLTLQQEYLLALRQYQELGNENPRFALFLDAAKKKLLLYGLTASQVSALSRTGQLDARITFLAPASGTITEIPVAPGQYVAEGSVLYRLARLDRLWVEAELYPHEVSGVKTGDRVSVLVAGAREPQAARVTFLSPELRAGSQVAVLRAELPNPEGRYQPGMQVSVQLQKGQQTALSLPAEAVIRDTRGAHVWVQSGKNTFKPRMVTLGKEGADAVSILSGLAENEKVVVSGAYLLYSEFVLKKGSDPMAGHNH